jgi:hypothetical protein
MSSLTGIENWALEELKTEGVFPKDFKIPRGSNFANFLMTVGVDALKALAVTHDDEEYNDSYLFLQSRVMNATGGFKSGQDTFPGPVTKPKISGKAPWVPRKRDRKIDEDEKIEIEAPPREIKRTATIPLEEFEEAVTDFSKCAGEFLKLVRSVTQ